jgi:soluble cytochrome b562
MNDAIVLHSFGLPSIAVLERLAYGRKEGRMLATFEMKAYEDGFDFFELAIDEEKENGDGS